MAPQQTHIELAAPSSAMTRTERTEPHIVSTQPVARTMSPTTPTDDGPSRLRGGCIPCPVRLLNDAPEIHRSDRAISFSIGRRYLLHYSSPVLLDARFSGMFCMDLTDYLRSRTLINCSLAAEPLFSRLKDESEDPTSYDVLPFTLSRRQYLARVSYCNYPLKTNSLAGQY
ncbi:hypothetical protein BOTBODRAFT_342424 [Botryobasidium botryosum FD-172 SS1]|uniref:Uncharacterized protein n=1 Tax=Botryobasidium botryosum (strain FD-172 SS1) TaxID=930990 RepID=A0A067MRG7_BOTB1|nr:hypothetical protein BOTBODRAFT_342424 [Botryobasidium botryosum FD-172 SS1]